MKEEFKKIKKLIKTYFPDVWQYLIIIIIMIVAGIYIL
jgi:hypothetical protein